jgi:hypothetical protein
MIMKNRAPGQHRRLLERARAADGRTQEVAAQEWEAAKQALERVLADKGAAQAAEQRARVLLGAAEAGQDLASAQLRVLGEAGVPAAALLDVVSLDSAERAEWEPRLALYRDAVVVHREQAAGARGLLAGLPGSVLVLADSPGAGAGGEVPGCGDSRFDLGAFLGAVGGRADGAGLTDGAAGVIVLGGFADPLTGRPGRIAAARQDHADQAGLLSEAGARLSAARKVLSRAEDRARAADAAEQADLVQAEIARLRKETRPRWNSASCSGRCWRPRRTNTPRRSVRRTPGTRC